MIPIQDADEARPVVSHRRDLIVFGDSIEQDYHFLDYAFTDHGFTARTYLHDMTTVLLLRANENPETIRVEAVPSPVLAYLKYRFDEVDVLGEQGLETLWSRR